MRVGISKNETPDLNIYHREDQVAALIREAATQAGLGKKDPNIPFADFIEPGMTVLLKPNWVTHANRSGHGTDCLVTHPSFILSALKEVAATRPGRILIGDSPIQSCQFNLLFTAEFVEAAQQIAGCPVEIIDFRRTIKKTIDGQVITQENVRDWSRYILFDLGNDSLLEPISTPPGRFRVTNYDPDEMTKTHHPGRHQYLLCREAFEADVILNLPKLKTHAKAGLTAALKNLVGLNGNKDYLPHHRLGGSDLGGDCYPGIQPIKRVAEYCLDNANRSKRGETYRRWIHIERKIIQVQTKLNGPQSTNVEGSWYGNDTVWRMSLDLNRLLLYGRLDGSLSDTPLRSIYSLTDGLIAGQGDGPLAPVPIWAGLVTLSASSPYADLAHSALMRFDWSNIPIVRHAFGHFRYPLTSGNPEQAEFYWKNQRLNYSDLADKLGSDFVPAQGWKGYLELNGARSL